MHMHTPQKMLSEPKTRNIHIIFGTHGAGHYRMCPENGAYFSEHQSRIASSQSNDEKGACESIMIVWRRWKRTRSRWVPCMIPNTRLLTDLLCATSFDSLKMYRDETTRITLERDTGFQTDA